MAYSPIRPLHRGVSNNGLSSPTYSIPHGVNFSTVQNRDKENILNWRTIKQNFCGRYSSLAKSIIFCLSCITLLTLYSIYNSNFVKFPTTFNYIPSLVNQGDRLENDELTKRWLYQQANIAMNKHPVGYNLDSSILNPTKDNFDPFSLTSGVNLWDLFVPSISCPDIERIGKVGEGGKWVCDLSRLSVLSLRDRSPPCIMYSFGISNDISFEMEILRRTPCTIYAFDPTIGKLPFDSLPVNSIWRNASMKESMKTRIIFHKIALDSSSGSTHLHSYNEHLFDIMHRLGHSYVDLLKVDVEGNEWRVFGDLYREKVQTLPVGQIFIELHYSTMEEISLFFNAMHHWGHHSFSREINLHPCLGGHKPFAAEYSFINVDNFYRANEKFSVVAAPHDASWHVPIKALIYILTMKKRIGKLKTSLKMLYDNFWKDYAGYPIVIFHDDLAASDQQSIQSIVPSMPLNFIRVSFVVPKNLLKRNVTIPVRTICDPKFSTLGYRHMCRFHADGVHDYLFRNGYENYEYIMRLDDDSFIEYTIGYDPFRFLKANNKKYGFVNSMLDNPDCVMGLWEHARKFANTSKSLLSNRSFIFDWPDPLVVYNNFEISHTSIWKHPLWKLFIESIDDVGGIYTLRWGDAPLHTIGISMILSRSDIHAFTDIAYEHSIFISQSPQGLPMPNLDPFSSELVKCKFYDDWTCTSTITGYNITANFTLDDLRQYEKYRDFALSLTPVARMQMKLVDSTSSYGIQHRRAERGVLFTFGHKGREEQLLATITSFHNNYASIYSTPFVVFFNINGGFEFRKLEESLKRRTMRPTITFLPVSLKNNSDIPMLTYCSSLDSEVNMASTFLRAEAGKLLMELGFEWFFRFGDDSRLLEPISYNIFERLRKEKRRYAYIDAMRGRDECISSLWELGDSICESLDQLYRSKVSPTIQCTPLFKQWTRKSVILTNFEISHSSVWESLQSMVLFDIIGEGLTAAGAKQLRKDIVDKIDLSHFNSSVISGWGDSALHTMCVIMSLKESELLQVTDFSYQFQWSSTVVSSIDDKRMQVKRFSYDPIVALDEVFSPQKRGWLGGDVATSVPLPRNPQDLKSPPNTAIWMFGDSIIGISDSTRRMQTHSSLVANTIGIAKLGPSIVDSSCTLNAENRTRKINDMQYYWRDDGTGAPMPIFNIYNDKDFCGLGGKIAIWPFAGIPISNGRDIKLVVVGSISCARRDVVGLSTGRAKSLDFDEGHTALFVVHNPYSLPDSWNYDYKIVPQGKKSLFRWAALASESGNQFATDKETIYILGGYQSDRNSRISFASAYQVFMRISAAELVKLNLHNLEVLCSVSAEPWQKSFGQFDNLVPQSLFSPMITEASLVRKGDNWLAISLHILERYIQVCQSNDIRKSWDCTFVAELDARWHHSSLITYAAKAHPYLLSEKCEEKENLKSRFETVVSFVSNSLVGPELLFQADYRSVYTPKFILLKEFPASKNRKIRW